MRKRKTFFISLTAIIAAVLLTTWLCNKAVIDSAGNKLYSDAKNIPYNKVGLLLGTTRQGRNGHINPYYNYRIQAAATLIKEKKIKYLIISGDNGRKEYNEPESMRSDLINAGIDSTVIYLDYAGFRTFDSMVRLKEIFGQDSVTVISQKFHNERHLYCVERRNKCHRLQCKRCKRETGAENPAQGKAGAGKSVCRLFIRNKTEIPG